MRLLCYICGYMPYIIVYTLLTRISLYFYLYTGEFVLLLSTAPVRSASAPLTLYPLAHTIAQPSAQAPARPQAVPSLSSTYTTTNTLNTNNTYTSKSLEKEEGYDIWQQGQGNVWSQSPFFSLPQARTPTALIATNTNSNTNTNNNNNSNKSHELSPQASYSIPSLGSASASSLTTKEPEDSGSGCGSPRLIHPKPMRDRSQSWQALSVSPSHSVSSAQLLEERLSSLSLAPDAALAGSVDRSATPLQVIYHPITAPFAVVNGKVVDIKEDQNYEGQKLTAQYEENMFDFEDDEYFL